ncbi:unnamed protein product [Enterobius vermicularis]|uniref:Phospholipase A(2) n=1 Tax=Enterobius vermicularis TaxID=51028 RepID=A0A0N4VFP9_ENTVE|nr:unnamed protein product [Enterobius vermicularis]
MFIVVDQMQLYLMILSAIRIPSIIATEYYCGPNDNLFTQLISKLFTTPCNQEAIKFLCIFYWISKDTIEISVNFCCLQHDRCYGDCGLTQRECDDYFCECLREIPSNFYCKLVFQ